MVTRATAPTAFAARSGTPGRSPRATMGRASTLSTTSMAQREQTCRRQSTRARVLSFLSISCFNTLLHFSSAFSSAFSSSFICNSAKRIWRTDLKSILRVCTRCALCAVTFAPTLPLKPPFLLPPLCPSVNLIFVFNLRFHFLLSATQRVLDDPCTMQDIC